MHKNLSKSDVQDLVWKFIYEFRDVAAEDFGDKVDFMIIYGSAVRREFVPGKSDVDIVIQILDVSDKARLEERASKIFFEIAEKYPELGFDKSLSVSKTKKRNAATKVLEKIEKSSFLYVPVFIFVKGEIDWENGKLSSSNPIINIGKHLLVPQRSVFLRFKQEGELLFGRDIREEIKIRLTFLDRVRIGLAPQLLSFIGFLISPLLLKKGQGYAVKALLYQVDSLLTALDEYEQMSRSSKVEKSQKILLEDFTEQLSKTIKIQLDYTKGLLKPRDFDLFELAAALKWGEKRLSRFGNTWFCLKAWWLILRTNLRAIFYLILKK